MFDDPKTKAEAMKRKYGSWQVGGRGGTSYNPDQCVEEVSTNERWPHYYQCKRKPGYGPDQLYCKLHDPEERERRRKVRSDKDRLKMDENSKRWHREAASQKLLDACKLCKSMLTVWSVDPDKSPNTILSTLMPALNAAIKAAEE